MNLREILPAVVASVAIGVLLFLLRMTQTVDADVHLERLARIRAIDNLDIQLNRLMTVARYTSIAVAGNDRTDITNNLGDELDAIDQGPHRLRGLSKDLDTKLNTFMNTIQDKFGIAFDFEARNTVANQRLIASMDATPAFMADVATATNAAEREHVKDVLERLKSHMTTFAVTPTPTNEPDLESLLKELETVSSTQSQDFRDALQRLNNNAAEVIADKHDLVNKLNEFLGLPTGVQLQAVEKSYTAWHEAQVAVANRYRIVLAAYAALLLAAVAFFVLRLRRSNRELDRANETLEAQVTERTKDLSTALQNLRASQAQLIQSEKMASLGQMIAGVAHEINTPLGYARSNTEIVRTSLGEIRQLFDAQANALNLILGEHASDEEVAQAVADAQSRMESLKPDELAGELDGLLGDTDHGLVQIAELVGSLKDFSRVDRSRSDLFNINDSIESALKICQNQLKHKVEVVKSLGDLPKVECAPSQLNQVFLNLFTNAAQAIEGDKGKLLIHSFKEGNGVSIRVIDNGKGMPDEVRKKIFEPFFTTKPVGQGTGLGLSIVYNIIKDHDGTIDVKSMPGKGTEFVIHLPLRQKQKQEAEMPEMAAVAAA